MSVATADRVSVATADRNLSFELCTGACDTEESRVQARRCVDSCSGGADDTVAGVGVASGGESLGVRVGSGSGVGSGFDGGACFCGGA